MSSADLRLLTRGRLLLTISSVSRPESLRLSGTIVTKATCELFQTTLSSGTATNVFGTSGLAWLYLNSEGSLVYNVQIDSLTSKPAVVTLVDFSTKKRTELLDLTPSLNEGWANGTFDKLSPKILEPLFSGNLGVNVATENENSLVRGRLTSKPVAEARDASAPYLLKRENFSLPASAVGIAWLFIDNDCCIHYDVSISSVGSKNLELSLEMVPMLAPGAPVIARHLDDFQSNQLEGSPLNSLSREEVHRLAKGVGFLKVKDKDTKSTLLAATIRNMAIPLTCQPNYPENNLCSDEISEDGDCVNEGKFYKEEAQWTSSTDPCTMCFCQNGASKCFSMKCPAINCPSNFQLREIPGECCPICTNTTQLLGESNTNVPQKCILNGQLYSPGSKFHPFLFPKGFDSCTVCTCDPIYLKIKCTRISTKKECCPDCPDHDMHADAAYPRTTNLGPKKELPTKSVSQILEEGGCTNAYDAKKPHVNGTEYHPFIDSLGEYKCVTCKCEVRKI